MIISCPKCNVGFFVSPEQIGATGRRVKCSKCKNIWHAVVLFDSIPKDEVIAQRIQSENIIPGANLPAIIPIKISNLLFAAPVTLMFLISLTLWIFYPNLTNKLGLCGSLCVPNGVKIEDISYEYDLLSQKIKVEYSVANRSAAKVAVPKVQLKLLDENNAILRTVYAEGQGLFLEPNSAIKAKSEFDGVSVHSKIVQIALGSTIKFLFR